MKGASGEEKDGEASFVLGRLVSPSQASSRVLLRFLAGEAPSSPPATLLPPLLPAHHWPQSSPQTCNVAAGRDSYQNGVTT